MAQTNEASVLIVDDTAANLQVLESILVNHGYKVRASLSGRTALKSAFAQPPDLILLDMYLPELNGAEICRMLKDDARTRAVPVIFISAVDSLADKIVAFKEGGVDYINWPFQVEEVLARVSTHLAVARAQAALALRNAELVQAIRDRQQVEENILALNKQLASRQHELEAANQNLESFAYSIAHDLRAPLRGIDGFVSVLLEDHETQLGVGSGGYLRRIKTIVARMATLIDDLLNLARVSGMDVTRQEVDLTEVARAVEEGLRRIEPERKVEITISPGVRADADPRLMQSVLENLLGNSWKFTSRKENARITFGVENIDGNPTYVVRDNGVGFDTNFSGKMFQQFHRLHATNEYEGTGIGLAIVDRIIKRHGGRIWADGVVGQGANFYFTL